MIVNIFVAHQMGSHVNCVVITVRSFEDSAPRVIEKLDVAASLKSVGIQSAACADNVLKTQTDTVRNTVARHLKIGGARIALRCTPKGRRGNHAV